MEFYPEATHTRVHQIVEEVHSYALPLNSLLRKNPHTDSSLHQEPIVNHEKLRVLRNARGAQKTKASSPTSGRSSQHGRSLPQDVEDFFSVFVTTRDCACEDACLAH